MPYVTLVKNMLKDFLQKLCDDLRIKEVPEEDKEKNFTFTVLPEIEIAFRDLDPGVFLKANIHTCPKQKKEDLFIRLMHANLLGQGTGGSIIGLDKKEKFLTLSLALPYEINYRHFKESLEDFVNYLIYWREEVEKAKKEAEENLI